MIVPDDPFLSTCIWWIGPPLLLSMLNFCYPAYLLLHAHLLLSMLIYYHPCSATTVHDHLLLPCLSVFIFLLLSMFSRGILMLLTMLISSYPCLSMFIPTTIYVCLRLHDHIYELVPMLLVHAYLFTFIISRIIYVDWSPFCCLCLLMSMATDTWSDSPCYLCVYIGLCLAWFHLFHIYKTSNTSSMHTRGSFVCLYTNAWLHFSKFMHIGVQVLSCLLEACMLGHWQLHPYFAVHLILWNFIRYLVVD